MCKRSPEEEERIINEILEDMGLEKYKISTSKRGTNIMWVKEKKEVKDNEPSKRD